MFNKLISYHLQSYPSRGCIAQKHHQGLGLTPDTGLECGSRLKHPDAPWDWKMYRPIDPFSTTPRYVDMSVPWSVWDM